jgi:hypothetical protein
MASSTKNLVELTKIQMVLGLLSALGLGGSLFYAHQTAAHARKAVEVSTDTAKRQLRSYVAIVEASSAGIAVGQRPRIKITLKNTGQTPADKFVVVGGIMLHASGTLPIFADSEIDRYGTISVGSGCDHHINLMLPEPLNKEFCESLMSERCYISVRLECRYVDIFGEAHSFVEILRSAVRGEEFVFTVP